MDWIKQILNFLKSSPVIIISIFIASSLILFLPISFVEKLYLLNFKNKYGTYLGLAFILSSSILLVIIVMKVWKKFLDKYEKYKLRKSQIKYLTELDDSKTELIKEFIKEDTHTLPIQMNNGLVVELESLRLISKAGELFTTDIYNGGFVIPYYLRSWVIKLINKEETLRKKFL